MGQLDSRAECRLLLLAVDRSGMMCDVVLQGCVCLGCCMASSSMHLCVLRVTAVVAAAARLTQLQHSNEFDLSAWLVGHSCHPREQHSVCGSGPDQNVFCPRKRVDVMS